MLEENCTMEKKNPPRQSPVQLRNNGVISEKKCDIQPNKNGRQRRGSSQGSTSRTPDVSQPPRPFPKRGKGDSDKRPRPRNCFDDRQREEIIEDNDMEDVVSTHSRKGNANHLLNFQMAPRHTDWRGRSARTGSARYEKQGVFRKTFRRTQERYMQANCQFIVHKSGEYTEQAVNPDTMVNWAKVELVRSFTTEMVCCPICLQVPFAGKITLCGHVFCWACILHYFNLGDKKSVDCPVCKCDVKQDDIRSVQLIEVPVFKIGDKIELKLMRKNRGSTHIAPVTEWEDRLGRPMSVTDGDNIKFSKLLVASQEEIQREVLDPEKAALSAHLAEAEDSEKFFIEMAMDILKKRETDLKMGLNLMHSGLTERIIPGLPVEQAKSGSTAEESPVETSPVLPAAEAAPATPLPSDISFDGSKVDKHYLDAFDEEVVDAEAVACVPPEVLSSDFEEGRDPEALVESGDSEVDKARGRGASESSSSSFVSEVPQGLATSTPEKPDQATEQPVMSQSASRQYRRGRAPVPKEHQYFYQASTGQQIFLSNLNYKCLTKEYGSIENCPPVISATITAIDGATMEEKIRFKHRYLSHLPLGCEFHFVELKLGEPVVSKETLSYYHAEFEKRRRERQRKKKDEKLRAKRHEIEQKKSFGIYPEMKIPLDNLSQFPSHLSTVAGSPPAQATGQDLGSSGEAWSQESKSGDSDASPWPLVGSPDSGHSLTSSEAWSEKSFANVVGQGGKWPASPWGRGLSASASVPSMMDRSPDVTHEDEDDVFSPPSYNTSFSAGFGVAVERLLRQTSLDDMEGGLTADAGGGKKKKKKQKKKEQVLFSTSRGFHTKKD